MSHRLVNPLANLSHEVREKSGDTIKKEQIGGPRSLRARGGVVVVVVARRELLDLWASPVEG